MHRGQWKFDAGKIYFSRFWVSIPVNNDNGKNAFEKADGGLDIEWEVTRRGGTVYLVGGDTVDPDSFVLIPRER